MTCASIAADLIDLARGASPGPVLRAAVERHVRTCADCAARLDRERALSADMRRLAGDTPAPCVDRTRELELLAAFDEAWAQPASSRKLRLTAGGLVGAIAAVIAWAVVRTPTVVPPAAAIPRQANTSIVTPTVIEVMQPRAQKPVRQHAASVPPANTIDPGPFIVWPGADELPTFESGHLVRVHLPADIVESIGLAPAVDTAVVEADILVDQGGFARAVRLVP